MIEDSGQRQAFAAENDRANGADSGFQQAEIAKKADAPAVDDRPLSTDDLQAVLNVPVRLRAVLGRARMDLGRLLRLGTGEIIELDRRAGEPVDIYINDRFAARGEVVLIDNVLGVTLTEIARQDR